MAHDALLFVLLLTASSLLVNSNAVDSRSQTLKSVLKGHLELPCSYSGSDEGLHWYKDDVSVKVDKPGHYDVKTDDKETILFIKIVVHSDAAVKKWYVRREQPGKDVQPIVCEFGQIELIPSPQSMSGNKAKELLEGSHGSIRRAEDETLRLTCNIDPPLGSTGLQNNKVEWFFGKTQETLGPIPAGITINGNELTIDRVNKNQRGFYRCELNKVHFTTFLRVKDRFAALWPLIGIVAVVVVLVIIILIFEKRQKSAKKTTAIDDDERDRADDPLVQSISKSSDNESKKRAVKA